MVSVLQGDEYSSCWRGGLLVFPSGSVGVGRALSLNGEREGWKMER